jgi:hypothetical protein
MHVEVASIKVPYSHDVASSIDDVHFKVKRKESIKPYKALKQAVSDWGVYPL